ncbi:MAG: hypothetical protein ACOC6I_02015 [Candidatus Bipolaricaulota bacterium]
MSLQNGKWIFKDMLTGFIPALHHRGPGKDLSSIVKMEEFDVGKRLKKLQLDIVI